MREGFRTRRVYRVSVLAALSLFAAFAFLAALRVGSLRLSLGELLTVLGGGGTSVQRQIIVNVRLPRNIAASLAGMCLALSGALLQGVMRNPLAAPNLIGVSSGAGLAAMIVLIALPNLYFLLVPAAFAGALTPTVLIYLLAWKQGVRPTRLIFWRGSRCRAFWAPSPTLDDLLSRPRSPGSSISWWAGSPAGPGSRCACSGLRCGRGRPGLSLARGLNHPGAGGRDGHRAGPVRGTDPGPLHRRQLRPGRRGGERKRGFWASWAHRPHMMRLLVGADYRFLLPASACSGPGSFVGCDAIGRMLLDPTELPWAS